MPRWIACAVVVCGLALASTAEAEIVLLSVGGAQGPAFAPARHGMSSIVLVPTTEPATDSSYLMQRSRAWGAYRRGERNSGLPLVVVPAISGTASATSPRQANARENLARANAYRLRLFGR